MSEVRAAASKLGLRERHELLSWLALQRDAEVVRRQPRWAGLWSAIACEVAAADDEERAIVNRFEDDVS